MERCKKISGRTADNIFPEKHPQIYAKKPPGKTGRLFQK